MKRIEFIGGSGVGKSTMFNMLLSKRAASDIWITSQEAKIQLAKKQKLREKHLSLSSLFIIMLRCNILKKKHLDMANRVLKKYEMKAFDQYLPAYNGLINLGIQALAKSSSMKPFQKLKFANFYFNLILYEVAMLDCFNINNLVVYDDGIIHNIPGTVDENAYKEMLYKEATVEQHINPVAIIYCNLSIEKYYLRKKSRIEEGKGTFIERILNKEELYDLCKRSLDNAYKKAQVMKNVGIPVLEVDMEKSIEHNAEEVLNFIRSLTQ